MSRKSVFLRVLSFFIVGISIGPAAAQVSRQATTLVTRSVNDSDRVTLRGNIHPAVRSGIDLGQVPESMRLEHMFLQLRRAPAAQQELDRYIQDLHDPKSPNFHKWGTAAQFSQRFGLAQQDLDSVETWLQSKGFRVNLVYPNLTIDFSGTAGQVREAFRTSIHRLDVNGVRHIANISDPQIPAAFASAVVGPVALHDFKPQPLSKIHKEYTLGSDTQAVVPLDLQTIYHLTPLYNAGLSGKGQTIVLLEDTNLYSNGDWYAFRKTLGLARPYPFGNLKIVHPQPGTAGNCADPGVGSHDSEAALDVEWASAAAPNATIELASCADTETNFGLLIALENLLTGAQPPSIISISYGIPESEVGADFSAYISALYQFAVFQGVSVFTSTGDAGADAVDQGRIAATHGINVSALASTPYNVAVGGTDFADTYLGENSSYWNETNGPSYNSAKSYLPEIPWNDSCASQLISTVLGFAKPYGADGACNSAVGQFFLDTAAGSGGPSGCAFGEAAIFGVVSGTCAGYTKPAYQSLVGNPQDGVRDLPDVSLFAGNGVWGHYYVFCYSDRDGGGVPCNTPPASWAGGGGTSFATPIMAGIQALVNQAAGSAQGNPNFVYYELARAEYGAQGNAACNSTTGNAVDPRCVFHDVTFGDIAVNCAPLTNSDGTTVGTFNCFYPKTNPGENGVLSTSNTDYKPAFPAKVGWDFATGIGTVDAYNLVTNWPGSRLAASKKK